MDNKYKQVIEVINKYNNILLVSKTKLNPDIFSSLIILKNLLTTFNKNVNIMNFPNIPANLEFLNELIYNTENLNNNLKVEINLDEIELENISYSKDKNKLFIDLKPKSNNQKQPIKIINNEIDAKIVDNFDLIICVGAKNLNELGTFYKNNMDMIYNTPIINIDINPQNELFGSFNLVQVKKSSITEITMSIMKELNQKITKEYATLILTGIITSTENFQNFRTTPNAFELSAYLISQGAMQQEIIKNIYKTKSLETLKNWGDILANLEINPISRVCWGIIKEEISSYDLEDLIDRILCNTVGVELVYLLDDKNKQIILIPTVNYIDLDLFINKLKLKRIKEQDNIFIYSYTKEKIINEIDEIQKERLNIAKSDLQQLENKKPKINIKEIENQIKL